MDYKMFCYQCQETANCSGCTVSGVCGKKPDTANMQDLLVYVTKGISAVTTQIRAEGKQIDKSINHLITLNLFTTITNANFDKDVIVERFTNAAGGKILLVKDSFSHCLAPFLAENYSEVILVDMRYYKNSISELAQQEKPDNILVLYGIDNLATDTDIAWLS